MSQLNPFPSSTNTHQNNTQPSVTKQSSVVEILSAPSFHFSINDIDRSKFETDEHSWDWNITLHVIPLNSLIDDTKEYPITIWYQFEKLNFTKWFRYWPNDTYDLSVSVELWEFQSTENFEAQIKSFLESMIRSGHIDTNWD